MSPRDSRKLGSCSESRFLTTYSFQIPTTYHFMIAESWREGARALLFWLPLHGALSTSRLLPSPN